MTPAKTTQNLVSLLSKYIHTVNEHGILLIAGWLIACMNPSRPKPVLCLSGEQGSAKSTTTRMLKKIADNSSVPLKSLPRNEQDLSIIAKNSWIPAFDNISSLTSWLSDAMSKISTGGGHSTRSLYTNDEESLWTFTRAIILNGINEIPKKSDLPNVPFVSTESDPRGRKKDRKRNQFDTDLPFIMGALLIVSPQFAGTMVSTYGIFHVWRISSQVGRTSPGILTGHSRYSTPGKSEHELNIEGNPLLQQSWNFLSANGALGRQSRTYGRTRKFVSDKTIRSNRWPNT